jgi:hypothetical protein
LLGFKNGLDLGSQSVPFRIGDRAEVRADLCEGVLDLGSRINRTAAAATTASATSAAEAASSARATGAATAAAASTAEATAAGATGTCHHWQGHPGNNREGC